MALYFDCKTRDSAGVLGMGWIKFSPGISANKLNIKVSGDPIDLSPPEMSISAGLKLSGVWFGDPISLALKVGASGDFLLGAVTLAWIKWSDIGHFDWEHGRDNVAGEMFLRWKGCVLKLLQLGTNVIAYGSGGISKLTPSENTYGQKTLQMTGIMSEWSVDGSEERHFFIDAKGRFCKTEEGKISILGYEEFLSHMFEPVVLYDRLDELVYITDDTYGYIYSIREESLGTCSPHITAATHSEYERFIAASETITKPVLEITSDILDFTTRNDKTIHEIEVGTNLTGTLEASMDFSMGIHSSFTNIGWHPVSPHGVATVPCFGREFKFSLRASSDCELDYVRIKGRIHDYNPIDT